jgi:Flp pilus assembly protein TadB
VAGRIVWAWVLTIPAAGLVAAVVYAVTVSRFAVVALALAAIALAAAVIAGRRQAAKQAREARQIPAG